MSRLSTHCGALAGGALSLIGLLAIGCGGSGNTGAGAGTEAQNSENLSSALKAVPTPEGGLALYTPVIHDIAPGDDKTYCTYLETRAPEDLFIHTTTGAQTKYGHHAILMYTQADEAPRTELCTGESMETLSQLVGGTGGEGMAGISGMPANTGTIIPKGARFVLQSHWINTGDKTVDVQAMMVTEPGPVEGRIVLGTVAVVNLDFNVAPHAKAESSVECVMDSDHKLLVAIGHEHEWGTHVRADFTPAGKPMQNLFDRDFSPSDTFDPPSTMWGIEQPLSLSRGDKLKMDCQWDNTTTTPLTFPREMCVFFGYALEPGDLRCINGTWLRSGNEAPAPDAGTPATP